MLKPALIVILAVGGITFALFQFGLTILLIDWLFG
jgi:hypothetical protein